MKLKACIYILFLLWSTISYSQDKIVLRDSTTIMCRIYEVNKIIIKYENFKTLKTEYISTDTIKAYTFRDKTYHSGDIVSSSLPYQLNPTNSKNSLFRLSFFIPSLSLETKLTKNTTGNIEFGTGFGYIQKSGYNYKEINIFRNSPPEDLDFYKIANKESGFEFYPYLKLELRHFYNLKRRIQHHRNTNNYSANYFSLYSLIYFNNSYFLAPTWGLQRNKNAFYFNLNLGLGLSSYNNETALLPLVDIRLGFLINS